MEDKKPAPDEVLHVLELITSPSFVSTVTQAEDTLAASRFNDGLIDELTDEYESQFAELIGPNAEDSDAEVTGKFYATDDKERMTGEMVVLDDTEMLYLKTTVILISGMPRIVFMFEMPRYYEDDVLHEEKVYYAEPANLRKFELFKAEDEDVQDILMAHVEMSHRFTTSEDFLTASLKEQVEYLETVQEIIEENIPIPEGDKVEIEAERFVVRYDDMPLPISECVTDQSNLELLDSFTPIGAYVGICFIELEDRVTPFRTVADFPITGGVACVVLRDDDQQATFYIPSDKVRSLVITEDSVS